MVIPLKRIQEAAEHALGIEVSETASRRARLRQPNVGFVAADMLDLDVYRHFRPDYIVWRKSHGMFGRNQHTEVLLPLRNAG